MTPSTRRVRALLRTWLGEQRPVTDPRLRTYGFWTAVFVVTAAVFAALVRIEAPVPASAAMGLAVVLVFGRLSRVDRIASTDGHMTAWYVAEAATAAVAVWLSWQGVLADDWGLAALSVFLYAFVRLVDRFRRWAHPRPALRIGAAGLSVAGTICALLPTGTWPRIVAAGVAVIVGAVAIELWSQSPPALVTTNRLWAGVAGGALVGVVSAWIWAQIHDRILVVLIAAAVAAVVGLLITPKDTAILLGVLLIAVIWSTVPRDATFPPGQKPLGDQPYFAVLGDSYISGEGTDRFFSGTNEPDPADPGKECRRSPDAWPMLLNPPQSHDTGDLLGIPTRVFNASCSGAVTEDLREHGPDTRSRHPEQITLLKDAIVEHGSPVFVIVGIGGNDALFTKIGSACVLPGDCTGFLDDIREQRLAAVGDRIAATLAEVRIAVGADVPVISVAYPKPLHVSDDGCTGVLLSRLDMEAINRFALALDDEVHDAAELTGAFYMDTVPSALSDAAVQLCEPNGPAGLNFADLNPKAGSLWTALNPGNWGHNFVHPNESGHQVLRAAALRWFQHHPCTLDGTCTPRPVDTIEALAEAPGPPLTDVTFDGRAAAADGLPLGLAVLALLSAGWWLLITAVVGWENLDTERRASMPERASVLLMRR